LIGTLDDIVNDGKRQVTRQKFWQKK
jgi:hypothetical protein